MKARTRSSPGPGSFAAGHSLATIITLGGCSELTTAVSGSWRSRAPTQPPHDDGVGSAGTIRARFTSPWSPRNCCNHPSSPTLGHRAYRWLAVRAPLRYARTVQGDGARVFVGRRSAPSLDILRKRLALDFTGWQTDNARSRARAGRAGAAGGRDCASAEADRVGQLWIC